MKKLARGFKWLLVTAVLVVNLAVGARLYSQETAAVEAKADQDSPYEMYTLFSKVVEQVRANYVDADKSTYCLRMLALLAAKGLAYDGGTGGGNNAARQAQAAVEAASLIRDAATIAQYRSGAVSTESKISWKAGHELIVLSEYYLQTGDPAVLPSIEALAVLIANGTSIHGTMGHQLAQPASFRRTKRSARALG